MQNMKALIITGITVLMLVGGTITVFASSQYKTPAEAVAGLSGREIQSIIDERAQTGKTYKTIASEAGVLDQFKAEILEMKKDYLAARVAAGTMTLEQADTIIARIEENQANCDGIRVGYRQNGRGLGAGDGFEQGRGHRGRGMGSGMDNNLSGRFCEP